MTSTFTSFLRLPAELRLLIWNFALPNSLEHALFPYQTGCYVTSPVEPDHPDYILGADNLFLLFDFMRLGTTNCDIPLFFVNNEARGVTKDYMQERGLLLRSDGGVLRIVRFFQPGDIVLVDADSFNALLAEPTERLFEPDIEDKSVSTPLDTFKHLAVTRDCLPNMHELVEFFTDWGYPKRLYIVDVQKRDGTCIRQDTRTSTRTSIGWTIPTHDLAEYGNVDKEVSDAIDNLNDVFARSPKDFKIGFRVVAPRSV